VKGVISVSLEREGGEMDVLGCFDYQWGNFFFHSLSVLD